MCRLLIEHSTECELEGDITCANQLVIIGITCIPSKIKSIFLYAERVTTNGNSLRLTILILKRNLDLDRALMAICVNASRNVICQHFIIELQGLALLYFEFDRVWSTWLHYVGAVFVLRCMDLYVCDKVSNVSADRTPHWFPQRDGALARYVGAYRLLGFG